MSPDSIKAAQPANASQLRLDTKPKEEIKAAAPSEEKGDSSKELALQERGIREITEA